MNKLDFNIKISAFLYESSQYFTKEDYKSRIIILVQRIVRHLKKVQTFLKHCSYFERKVQMI